MKILPDKLSRYAAVATLFMKYGRSSASPATATPLTELTEPPDDGDAPEQLARDLEALGPTFVKLGQVLSSRPDLMPARYIEALERLQDNVKPFPFPDVQQIIETDLGVRLSKAFATFDEKPLAAASLGQVHRATLRDGTPVAVKVQRLDVAQQVAKDLEALEEIARFLEKHSETGKTYDVVGMVAEFRDAITAELDYVKEAGNLRLMAKNLAEFDMVVVPQPIEGYVSTRVLTMQYVSGTKVTAISPVVRLDLDGEALGETLIRAYLKQIVIDGIFHADPHPGNVFVTDDGRLALLDLGMIGRITPAMQEKLLKLLLAISEGRGEDAADVTVVLGEKLEDFDERAFKKAIATLVGKYGHQSLADFQIGRAFIELNNVTREHRMRPPAELTMLGKTLLHLTRLRARSNRISTSTNRSAGTVQT